MNPDFHYYATYCAAYLAGYPHEECLGICYSDQLVDLCSKTFLSRIGAPLSAATTQLSLEMMSARTDIKGLQDITGIWSSFHFLPGDLYAEVKKGSKRYKDKYRMICSPNGNLVIRTAELAKGRGTQATGIAMHVIADTWAHRYFAGTPSLVINNTNDHFYELISEGDGFIQKKMQFRHSPSAADDLDKGIFSNSLYQISENTIMNLGHGRAGHLPDYSFIRYKYLPAWGGYEELVKDNPSDYLHAFCQMIYAMKYINGSSDVFEKDVYDWEAISSLKNEIQTIIGKRRLSAEDDWKALGERMSGYEIPNFDLERYIPEYTDADETEKDETFLGKFIIGALAQKSMVIHEVYSSGNSLAGVSVDYGDEGFRGNRDYEKLLKNRMRGSRK